jgi:hypothetical protein
LISISNDGKLCSWSLENLNLPVESQDLLIKSTNTANKNVYATCFDFQNAIKQQPISDKNQTDLVTPLVSSNQINQRNAMIGAEDGLVHSLNINSK